MSTSSQFPSSRPNCARSPRDLPLLEGNLSLWIRYHANVNSDISRSLIRAIRKLDIIFHQYLGEKHLDLIARKEAARASVRANTPMKLVGAGGDELNSMSVST